MCTDPTDCCTELIKQHGIKKVFIGILDPNQGVRGKGLWELQTNGIYVELFPPDLAKRPRVLNHKFIRIQRPGIRITNLRSGQTIRTFDKGGVFELQGSFLNLPGDDVFGSPVSAVCGTHGLTDYKLRAIGNGRLISILAAMARTPSAL